MQGISGVFDNIRHKQQQPGTITGALAGISLLTQFWIGMQRTLYDLKMTAAEKKVSTI